MLLTEKCEPPLEWNYFKYTSNKLLELHLGPSIEDIVWNFSLLQ